MEQSSILSAKFDCPVARYNISLLATAHDCETGLLTQSTFAWHYEDVERTFEVKRFNG